MAKKGQAAAMFFPVRFASYFKSSQQLYIDRLKDKPVDTKELKLPTILTVTNEEHVAILETLQKDDQIEVNVSYNADEEPTLMALRALPAV